MAEHTELTKHQDPDATPLFGHSHSFGVANDLERLRQGRLPPPKPPRIVGKQRGDHPLDHRFWQCWGEGRRRGIEGRAWRHLRDRWANSEHRPVDIWHRCRCRFGRHEIRGGEQIQLGSRFEHIERRCRWCGTRP